MININANTYLNSTKYLKKKKKLNVFHFTNGSIDICFDSMFEDICRIQIKCTHVVFFTMYLYISIFFSNFDSASRKRVVQTRSQKWNGGRAFILIYFRKGKLRERSQWPRLQIWQRQWAQHNRRGHPIVIWGRRTPKVGRQRRKLSECLGHRKLLRLFHILVGHLPRHLRFIYSGSQLQKGLFTVTIHFYRISEPLVMSLSNIFVYSPLCQS